MKVPRRFVSALLAAAASAGLACAQIDGPLRSDGTPPIKIAGTAPAGAEVSICDLTINAGLETVNTIRAAADGHFITYLREPLTAHHVIQLTSGGAGNCAASAPIGDPLVVLASGSEGRISGPLIEGSKTVNGTAPINESLQLWDVQAGQVISSATFSASAGSSAPPDSIGVFQVTLPSPLVAGQQVELRSATTGVALAAPVTVAGFADWGRVRGTLVAGAVLSNDSNFQMQGTQSSLFLDFLVDKNWRWAGIRRTPAGMTLTRRMLFTTYFETRLTSIPEAQKTSVSTVSSQTTPGKPQIMKSLPSAHIRDTTSTPTTMTDTLDTFIGSRKSATLQAGAYFPIITNKWTWQNNPNALFLAPIAKVGFATPTGPATTSTTTTAAATPQTSQTLTTEPVNPQQFYTFYGWGARIGHYKLSYNSNEAPELLSYIDVIAGRFSNLPTIVNAINPQTGQPYPNLDGSIRTVPVRRYRIAIEGALKVPTTPLVVGFSANIGQNLLLKQHVQSAKDDLRFFFGARFDIGKLFSKLQQF